MFEERSPFVVGAVVGAGRLTPPSALFDMGAAGAAALIGEASVGEREEALDDDEAVDEPARGWINASLELRNVTATSL